MQRQQVAQSSYGFVSKLGDFVKQDALPFFQDNPEKDLANGPDNKTAIELIENILACEGVVQVYTDDDDEDALFIQVEENVEPQLVIEVGYARPDECHWDDEMIRIWWD
jgi:hypothetical protein